MYRQTWAEVNLKNIFHNYALIQKKVPDKTIIPVIKADAYGHGAIEVACYLKEKGVQFFAVNLLDEAIELKNCDESFEVLVLGAVNKGDIPKLSERNIIFTIHDEDMLKTVSKSKKRLRFHIKIDTGMNRLGLKSVDTVNTYLRSIIKNENLHFEGIYTHLSASDYDDKFTDKQLQTFRIFLDDLFVKPKIVHASNSSATLKHENGLSFTTHARVGIALYGYLLENENHGLKPALKVLTHVIQVKELKKDDTAGYANAYKAKEDCKIAILPIGYADGIIRANSGGDVSINNKPYTIIGRISMDQMHIKIDNTIQKNDIVTIVGDDIVSVDDVAKRLNTISYEVLTLISKRVPRLYIK